MRTQEPLPRCIECNREHSQYDNLIYGPLNIHGICSRCISWLRYIQLGELKRKYREVCLCCNHHIANTIDHVIPFNGFCGSDAIENLQPLCRSCNSRKGGSIKDHRPGSQIDYAVFNDREGETFGGYFRRLRALNWIVLDQELLDAKIAQLEDAGLSDQLSYYSRFNRER